VTPSPRRYGYLATIAPLAIVLAVFGLLYRYDATTLGMLRELARAPRASLASPVNGPAVYSGRVAGPADRRSPAGRPVAASWWQVSSPTRKNRRVRCSDGQQDGLALRAGDRTAPLSFLDGRTAAFVIGETDSDDWQSRRVIDLGPVPWTRLDARPAIPGGCRTVVGLYAERALANGTAVEVYACYARDALGPCDGPVAGVASVGSLRAHRRRRAEDVRQDYRLAAIVSLVVILVFGLRAFAFDKTTVEVLAPRRRSRA
jgi:hypothetical protein